jgi:hypothetical protein
MYMPVAGALLFEALMVVIFIWASSYAFSCYQHVPGQVHLECRWIAVFLFPLIPFALKDYIAPRLGGIAFNLIICFVGLAASILSMNVTFGLVTCLWSSFWCLVLGFSHFVVPHELFRKRTPAQWSLVAALLCLSCCCTYHKHRCTLSLYGLVQVAAMGVGYDWMDGHDSLAGLLTVCTDIILFLICVYGMWLFVRRHRKLPPGLRGCKFLRLDCLQDMVSRGEPIRRCQD